MQRIFVTGGTGFVGTALLNRLASEDGRQICALIRASHALMPGNIESAHIETGIDAPETVFPLHNTDVVVHCAARTHVMNDKAAEPLTEFRRVNVAGTLNLARQAAQAGVKRFVFLSSIKVNGERTQPGTAFTADDSPAPEDPYGISKSEAERELMKLSEQTGIEVVIVRPVLVYGPGVKANFRTMMTLLNTGWPLPFGTLRNKRSLVALDNLVDLLITCIDHSAAANEVFLVSDGEDLSTPELLRRMGHALGQPARLIPVPESVLRAGASMLGKQAVAQRLCGSLQVDIGKTQKLLNWQPRMDVDEALRQTAHDFLAHHERKSA